MRNLMVFNSISIDGYFCDEKNDMSWAHRGGDPEFDAFSAQNASGDGMLLFGRVTYEMMSSFWPTPQAQKQYPEVARGMNEMPKVVFSRTLKEASWKNTRVVSGDIIGAVREMKQQPGPNLVVLGSGTIVSQLAQARLVDQYQLVVVPIVLGKGRTLFEGVKEKQNLKLKTSRPFKNGNVVLDYEWGK
jgi:dihydrofolate reductase